MQLGLGAIHELDDERLELAAQLGVPNIIMHTPQLSGDGYWPYRDLLGLRKRVESAGLMLYGIENVPRHFYDKVLEGRPGRDEQIEAMQRTIRNMGRAGIKVLGYHFNVLGVWRTERTRRGRGGAWVTIYDHRLVENAPIADCGEIDADTLWDSFAYFLRAVVPVAEEEGVMLALHPNDPPVASIAGVARLIQSPDDYRRVMDLVESPANGIDFCQGTMSEACERPEQVYDAIRYFASRDKIAYVHFRNVKGVLPRFEESFIDDGKVDMLEAMRAYKESNFRGVFIVDHTPGIVGDTRWGHRGRAYGIGYIKGLLKCVNA